MTETTHYQIFLAALPSICVCVCVWLQTCMFCMCVDSATRVVNVYMCSHGCGGLRLMSRMTLNCFSTFFFEARRFLQSTLEPLDMAGLASQISLEKPLSQLQGAKIAEGLLTHSVFSWVLRISGPPACRASLSLLVWMFLYLLDN